MVGLTVVLRDNALLEFDFFIIEEQVLHYRILNFAGEEVEQLVANLALSEYSVLQTQVHEDLPEVHGHLGHNGLGCL